MGIAILKNVILLKNASSTNLRKNKLTIRKAISLIYEGGFEFFNVVWDLSSLDASEALFARYVLVLADAWLCGVASGSASFEFGY